MSKIKKIISTLVLAFLLFNTSSYAQSYKMDPIHFYVFDKDSLKGFDEEAARKSAISEQYLGAEFKVRMYQLKRSFINNRYNLWPKPIKDQYSFNASPKLSVVPGCTNEDFEASAAGSVTAQNQITGWTITRGNMNAPNDACNLTGCCSSNPIESELINAPAGIIDPVIGNIYPIYSVFGSTPGNAGGPTNNPQITQSMFGDKFIRINSSGLGAQAYSIEKLSKTFAVTANNALFQFAFIFVTSTGHDCCGAGAFQIKLTNATANTLIPCPSYSAAGPSGSCQNYTVNGIPFLNATTGTSATVNSGIVFNKWQLNSMDLTPYIGQNITIDVILNDCNGSGHYGYAYFDAQCGPMVVYGNGTPYGAGSGNILVPTCGASGATLCASSGLGPYSWAGPGVVAPFNVPSMANQCYTTNISGTYTLFMNPQGSCAPISRVMSATITPAPLLAASVVQAVCGSTTAVVTITPSGSAAVPSTLSWSPTPLSINQGTTQGTYVIPPGPAPTIVTITATDPLGCFVMVTASVNPAAPFPTFTVNNVTGTNSITCTNFSVTLDALTTYTYGTLNFNWVSSSASFSGTPVTITTPGTFVTTAVDPVSGCSATRTTVIGQNTVPPTTTISPLLQNITCANPTIGIVTAQSNPTINIQYQFIDQFGASQTILSPTAILSPAPGISTVVLTNLLNGCTVTKTFSVLQGGGFPKFTVNSPQQFTLGCASHSVATINIAGGETTDGAGNGNGGSVTYTLLPPNTGTNSYNPLPGISTYTVAVPGTWTVVVKDPNSGCETKVPISVIQNTFGPQIDAIVPTQTLSCYTTSVQLQGTSTTSFVTYSWLTPVGNQVGNQLAVFTTTNVTNTLVANYVLTLTDQNNACKSSSTIPMYQNLFPPNVGVAPSGTAITCVTSSITLSNNSSVASPTNFPRTQVVQGYLWQGPPPQVDGNISSTYVALIPGTYTLTGKDLNNGCINTKTVAIADNRIFPVVNNPVKPDDYFLDCGSATVAISAIITNPAPNFTYLWSVAGAGTTSTSVLTNSVLNVNTTGEFIVDVTNPSNGCKTQGEVHVISGTLTSRFTPDQVSGYAPLTVNFTNNSASSSTLNATANINSVWNFGNGTSSVTPSSSIVPTAVYNQPGTYTVTMYSNKGVCQNTAVKIIRVDIPSKLEVPNVFTPNGDGSNDVFFLRAANLTEITALIYDRWGHKIFEVTSNTGNIAWDGKNQVGKEVPEGTYFYIITSKGKDGKDYDTKGTVNLYR